MTVQRRTLLFAALAASTAAPVVAQFPALDQVSPQGAQRGTEIELVLSGKKLAGATELLFEPPDIEVLELAPHEKPDRLRARLLIAPDAALGLHAVWVRTPAGLSTLRLFSVGALPESAEVEPNDTRAEAHEIELGHTLVGEVVEDDVDLFAFHGTAGERVVFEIEALRLGGSFDAALEVFDDEGFVIAACDDAALTRQDPLLFCELPRDGRYCVRVRESAFRGKRGSHYRLHVGGFPRPVGALPLGARPGEPVELSWLGPAGEIARSSVTLPTARAHGGWVPPGVVSMPYADESGAAPTPVWLRAVDLDNAFEVEPNRAFADATPVALPTAINAVLGEPGDVDRFVFTASKNEQLDIAAFARALRTPVDPVLVVHAVKDTKYLASNDDDDGQPDSRLRFKAPRDGEYVLTVYDHLRRGGPDFAYRVELSRVRGGVRLAIGGQRHSIGVPRGGRTTFNVQVERQDLAGPLDLEISGLPAGVTAQSHPVQQGQNLTPVVLVASAGAAAPDTDADTDADTAEMAMIQIRARDAEGNVRGELYYDVELVRGRNQTVFWSHSLDRFPVARAQPVPIEVFVEAPPVPILRSGSIALEVRVERGTGFEGAVDLTLPFVPVGLNAARQARVEPDASRATFEISAAGDARLGTWPLVVAAELDVGGVRMRTSSAFFELEVGARLLAVKSEPVALERGAVGALFFELERLEGFPGAARLELAGLPHAVTSDEQTIDGEAATLTFPLRTTGESPIGKHRGLQLRALFPLDGGEALQTFNVAELRIQEPAPAVASAATAVEANAARPETPARPPTRLEKLRADHAVRLAERRRREDAEAGQSGGAEGGQ